MVKTKWLAALSDGSVAIEGEHPYEEIPNELSPWQRLLADLTDIHITGMRVQVSKPNEATRTYNLPSHNKAPAGNHEKWVTLRPRDPERYSYGRVVTRCMMSGGEKHHIVIRAHYADFTVSLYVDEDEGNESWVVVHEEE